MDVSNALISFQNFRISSSAAGKLKSEERLHQLTEAPTKKTPSGKLAEMITRDFGTTDALVKKLAAEAVGHFASGWAWLVLDDGKLKVTSFHDADTPLAHNVAPLFTLDVWEHAYYIDYRNARPKFAETVLANLLNWDFVAQNLDGKGASRADQKG